MPTSSSSYDFIVVGAGTAGSVIASRLTEDPSARVLLLEAGSATPAPTSGNPTLWPTLIGTSVDWGDSTTVQSATGSSVRLARGRGIGGSSATNGLMFLRGHRASYAAWESVGAKSWGFDDLLPYFKRSETVADGDPALRGDNGPMRVGPIDPLPPVIAAGLDAAAQCGIMQPHSRGSVRLSAPHTGAPPIIDPNYFGDERDLRTMVTALRLARQIGDASAYDEWREAEAAPGATGDDDNALREFAKAAGQSYFHPVGTCAMGDTAMSVVDSELRVHGVNGLRVADASVMPSIPSANTAATVYAIAERAAEIVGG